MLKCESSFPAQRGSCHPVGGHIHGIMHPDFLLTLLCYLDAQGFKRFFRVTWEPCEARFHSIENKFIHHANIVVRLAGAEYQIHFYGQCYSQKVALNKLGNI